MNPGKDSGLTKTEQMAVVGLAAGWSTCSARQATEVEYSTLLAVPDPARLACTLVLRIAHLVHTGTKDPENTGPLLELAPALNMVEALLEVATLRPDVARAAARALYPAAVLAGGPPTQLGHGQGQESPLDATDGACLALRLLLTAVVVSPLGNPAAGKLLVLAAV